ncbi:MAG: hypothetical protein CMJ18_09745 [Phycisphaeraceae bacterium]|nr:hypothetical protein [Phycisphaeraceae bacterium]
MNKRILGLAVNPLAYVIVVAIALVAWSHLRQPLTSTSFDRVEYVGRHPVTLLLLLAGLGIIVYTIVSGTRRWWIGLLAALVIVVGAGAMTGFAFQVGNEALYEWLGRAEQKANMQRDRLREIEAARHRLSEMLDSHRQRSPQFGVVRLSSDWANDLTEEGHREIPATIELLRTLVERFENDFKQVAIDEIESLTLRLSQATILNVDRRYQKTVGLLSEQDTRLEDRFDDELDVVIEANQIRGDAYYGLQEWQSAIGHYDAILATRESRWNTHADVANCLYNLGRFDESLDHYDILVAQRSAAVDAGGREEWGPSLASVHARRAAAYLRQGKLNDAVVDYRKAVDLFTELYEKLRTRELAAQLVTSLNNRGFTLAGTGDLDQAVRDYDRAIELRSSVLEQNAAAARDNNLAGALNNRGVALAGMGKYNEAIVDYKRAIEIRQYLVEEAGYTVLNNSLAHVYNNLGLATSALGKNARAIRSFDRAVKILTLEAAKHDHPELANNLATNLTDRGRTAIAVGKANDAIRDFNRAISIREELFRRIKDPRLADDLARTLNSRSIAFSGLGQFHLALRDFDRSIDLYSRLIKIDNRTPYRSGLARTLSYRGLTHADRGDRATAIDDFQAAIEHYTDIIGTVAQEATLTKELANTLNNLGNEHASMGLVDEAIADYKRAIDIYIELIEQDGRHELSNDLARSLNNLGNAYLSKGKLDLVIESYDQAIRIRTELLKDQGSDTVANDLARTHLDRGFQRFLQGKRPLGYADLEQAEKIAKDPRLRRRISKTLREMDQGTQQGGLFNVNDGNKVDLTGISEHMQQLMQERMEKIAHNEAGFEMPQPQRTTSDDPAARMYDKTRKMIDQLNAPTTPMELKQDDEDKAFDFDL